MKRIAAALVAMLVPSGRLALGRIGRRSLLLIACGTVIFCVLAALIERLADASSHNGSASSDALWGPCFGLAIPLASMLLVSVSLSRNRPENAVQCMALLGANRRHALVGTLLATSAVASLIGLLAAAVTALVASERWDAAAMHDAMTSAWIGALTACVYVFFFGAASTVGKRGGGCYWAFGADWLIGPWVGVGAMPFPRSHALNLLGADPVLELPQRASFAVLIALIGVYATTTLVRTRP